LLVKTFGCGTLRSKAGDRGKSFFHKNCYFGVWSKEISNLFISVNRGSDASTPSSNLIEEFKQLSDKVDRRPFGLWVLD
jgi:hypothetical protein